MPLTNCKIILIQCPSGNFNYSKQYKTAWAIKIMFQNKYQSKFLSERQNKYLKFLIDPSFQGVNRLFLLLYQNEDDRKVHTWYYLPKVEIKDYNVMIDGKSFFDQPVNPKRAGGAARGKRGRGGWGGCKLTPL